MQKIKFFVVLFGCSLSIKAQGCSIGIGHLNLDNANLRCIENAGNTILNEVKIDGRIVIVGKTKLSKVNINGKTKIIGHLKGTNITINHLHTIGKVSLNGTSCIKGETFVIGNLIASNTKFLKKILLISEKLELNAGTHTKSIHFLKNRDKTQEEYIFLNGATVDGDITFESKNGYIIMSNGAKIKGFVNGGKVQVL